MKLTVFNGSPRGEKSNSARMIPWVTDIKLENICHLNKLSQHGSYLDMARSSSIFLFIFPLYVDSMPGITKVFFEIMEKNKALFSGKPVYFIIHSGFPEMIQSKTLSKYTKYFSTKIMKMDYMGTVIIGGSEAMQMAPDGAFRKLQSALGIVRESIENNQEIPEDLNIRINKRDRLTLIQRFLFTINPLKDFYWHYRARKNKNRIDLKAQPYI